MSSAGRVEKTGVNIYFDDCRRVVPYDMRSLSSGALSGTESTVVRVAESLAAAGHRVFIHQLGREHWVSEAGVSYCEGPPSEQMNAVVVVRKAKRLAELRRRYSSARLILWLHNFQTLTHLGYRSRILSAAASVVCVSASHARATASCYNGRVWGRLLMLTQGRRKVPINHVYNAIPEDLAPDATPIDENKLVFCSAPEKGLEQVLEHFRPLRREFPRLRLYVADPGYSGDRARQLCSGVEGVEFIGPQPGMRMREHVRQALCIFYPQAVYPETFGLVFAEANAVGTPVMAHDFGAAAEVLGDSEQLVDANDKAAVRAKLLRWQQPGCRPVVRGRDEFRLSRVMERWAEVLGT